jgi:hypothetical protein
MSRILLIALLFTSLTGTAQVQPPKKQPTSTPIAKWRPPAVRSFLAKFTGPNAVCSAEEGKQIITLPLRIVDDKNNPYAISSYQFAYTRLGVKENEETGELSPATDIASQPFSVTPLPDIWKNNIIEQLKKGETLFFFDIIVMDKQGRRFFAPELKITIQ